MDGTFFWSTGVKKIALLRIFEEVQLTDLELLKLFKYFFLVIVEKYNKIIQFQKWAFFKTVLKKLCQ